jgi:hypothetical protein
VNRRFLFIALMLALAGLAFSYSSANADSDDGSIQAQVSDTVPTVADDTPPVPPYDSVPVDSVPVDTIPVDSIPVDTVPPPPTDETVPPPPDSTTPPAKSLATSYQCTTFTVTNNGAVGVNVGITLENPLSETFVYQPLPAGESRSVTLKVGQKATLITTDSNVSLTGNASFIGQDCTAAPATTAPPAHPPHSLPNTGPDEELIKWVLIIGGFAVAIGIMVLIAKNPHTGGMR